MKTQTNKVIYNGKEYEVISKTDGLATIKRDNSVICVSSDSITTKNSGKVAEANENSAEDTQAAPPVDEAI